MTSANTAGQVPAPIVKTPTARWLVPVLYVVSAAAFIADLSRDDTLAYGIIYTPLIATAVFHKCRLGLWVISAIACLMVLIGAFMPVVNPDLPDLIGNRVLSIFAIVATACLVRHARRVQERLSAQTRRAEAAEQIKTDVLTSISKEIRIPLHTMLGVLRLTMVATPPDQREALGRISSDGKRLLATIHDLLDMTQIEDRTLRRQPIDIATIARDAAENARIAARERQVSIALNSAQDAAKAAAIGDSWAMRRILDNLLANAVRLTPPGGTVSVSVARAADTVTTSVSDAGNILAPQLGHDDPDSSPSFDASAPAAASGTGLTLSKHLARAMNTKLTARHEPDTGATLCLSLPAATTMSPD